MTPPFTLEERELMQSIGGTSGYLTVCANRLRAERPELFQPSPETVAAFDTFRRVGSTDICMRRDCIDARAECLADCVCKPEDKAFFQELPAPKPFELAILPSKYRNLIFPGIAPECPKCGALDCTKNHAEFM